MEEEKKAIDESWKEAVSKEREAKKTNQKTNKESMPPEASFSFFISTFALQASVSLGLIPNPATNKTEKNLAQAKFIIDTLDVLKDKTKNNLDSNESSLLENMLYELKMQYVSTNKAPKQ